MKATLRKCDECPHLEECRRRLFTRERLLCEEPLVVERGKEPRGWTTWSRKSSPGLGVRRGRLTLRVA